MTGDLTTIPDDRLPVLAAQINAAHELACKTAQATLRHAISVGEYLIDAKALMKHGQWLPWLAENFDFSERTAQDYMRLADHKLEIETKSAAVADLTTRDALKLIRKAKPVEPNIDPAFDVPLVPVEPEDKAADRHLIRHIGIDPSNGLGPGGNDDDDIDAMQAEIDELREYAAALERDVAELKAENKKFEEMRVQYEMGGFAKVIEGKDEQIRVLNRRVVVENNEKIRNLDSMKWWREQAIKHGYSRDVVIPLDEPAGGAA